MDSVLSHGINFSFSFFFPCHIESYVLSKTSSMSPKKIKQINIAQIEIETKKPYC